MSTNSWWNFQSELCHLPCRPPPGLNLNHELCQQKEDEWLPGSLVELVGNPVFHLLMASLLMAEGRFKTLLKCSIHLSTVFVLSVISVFPSAPRIGDGSDYVGP